MTRCLFTGATGFLGRELLVRLLASGRGVIVTMRRRGSSDTLEAARARLVEMVRETAPGTPLGSLSVVFGDVTEAGLGLDAAASALVEEGGGPVQVLHGAAQIRFDLPYAEMELQNVTGTANVLALSKGLMERGRLHRFDYVSTAYVAGDRTDLVREGELDGGQRPRNGYERSKLEAEKAVAAARAAGMPVTVHRPSIIVGDSRTGRASSFKVLYWPMKLYARGRFRTMFGRPSCTVDVVPVDFVADAMLYLLDLPAAAGGTFHLAAGPDRQSTVAELVSMAEDHFKGRRVRYLDPDVYTRWLRPVLLPLIKLFRPDVAESGGVFLPYLRANPTFDTSEATRLLGAAGIEPPRVPSYFEAIFRYASETDFGRRLPAALPPGG